MSNIKKINNLSINNYGTIGSLIGGYITDYMNENEIQTINEKIDILNDRLKDFDIFKYKIINRIKIRNFLVKVLSEEDDIFIDLATNLLTLSEENLENIIDSFIKLTKNDIDVLYYNLWKKRNNDKFDIKYLKDEINNNYEFTPDLIMSYEYRVNKEDFDIKKNSLIIGENLTLMPNLESSNIFNVFEKLAYNNFIKLSKYIPDIKKDFFETYLCFKFTYLGIYFCRIMETIEKQNGGVLRMNEEFIKLLEMEYQELKQGLSKASIEGKGTPQEIADRKEELFHTFFKKYFPFPYRITKGNIVDSYNNRSASIDCIILDPSHPYTIDPKNNKASIILADGVDYAIEIKGSLSNKDEIARTLNQIKSVKELTRIRNGLLYKKDQNEYIFKIPSIIYSEKTYSNIETLIEYILDFYKDNKIKRLYQFDILIAGDYTIINSCKGQISFKDAERGIFFEKTNDRTLAVLLFLMANMPLVQPAINENIYNLYLDKVLLESSYRDDWNMILDEIENS